MNYYAILHTLLLVVILLLMTRSICYYCIKHRSKRKYMLPYFDDIINANNLDLDNISICEKNHMEISNNDVNVLFKITF